MKSLVLLMCTCITLHAMNKNNATEDFHLLKINHKVTDYVELPKDHSDEKKSKDFLLKISNSEAQYIVKSILTQHKGDVTSWKRSQLNTYSWSRERKMTINEQLAVTEACKLCKKLASLKTTKLGKENKKVTITTHRYYNLLVRLNFEEEQKIENIRALAEKNACVTELSTHSIDTVLSNEKKPSEECCIII